MRYKFNNNVTELDLSDMVHPVMYRHFRNDGRALGNMIEDILDFKFENLIKREDNEYYDMDTVEGNRVEVRVKGFSFEASSNVGKGRSGANPQDTLDKINKVTDWIFVEIDNFPKVKLYHVSGEAAQEFWLGDNAPTTQKKHLSSKKFKEVFYGSMS